MSGSERALILGQCTIVSIHQGWVCSLVCSEETNFGLIMAIPIRTHLAECSRPSPSPPSPPFPLFPPPGVMVRVVTVVAGALTATHHTGQLPIGPIVCLSVCLSVCPLLIVLWRWYRHGAVTREHLDRAPNFTGSRVKF